jgi:hypothetical protein
MQSCDIVGWFSLTGGNIAPSPARSLSHFSYTYNASLCSPHSMSYPTTIHVSTSTPIATQPTEGLALLHGTLLAPYHDRQGTVCTYDQCIFPVPVVLSSFANTGVSFKNTFVYGVGSIAGRSLEVNDCSTGLPIDITHSHPFAGERSHIMYAIPFLLLLCTYSPFPPKAASSHIHSRTSNARFAQRLRQPCLLQALAPKTSLHLSLPWP